jgi:hypothetical protein
MHISRFFVRHPTIVALASVLMLSGGATLTADDAHAKPGAADHQHGAPIDIKFKSVGEAWAVVQVMLAEIEALTAKKQLPGVHSAEEKLSAALRYLQANSAMVTGDKAKRLEAALRQALVLSENVHAASDAGDATKTETELKKLRAGLKLVEVQYPADALKAPPGVVQYVCAMRDFTGDKPGKCPECGMTLNPVLAGHLAMAGHQHGAAEPTMTLAAASAQPLMVGQKADVTLTIKKKDGTPVTPDGLEVAHTQKVHALIIDPSLTDYHHEHPQPTGKPGEYAFSFIPRKPGPYRIWADLVPKGGAQEYAVADLAAQTQPEPITNRTESLKAVVDGLTYTLTFQQPLKAGDAILGTLTVADAKGAVFPSLEPVMGAYAHIVGFSEDFKTIAHIHPMGEEPTKPTDRGAGKLDFHLVPGQPGLLRLFTQVQIGGENKFAPFTLNIQK